MVPTSGPSAECRLAQHRAELEYALEHGNPWFELLANARPLARRLLEANSHSRLRELSAYCEFNFSVTIEVQLQHDDNLRVRGCLRSGDVTAAFNAVLASTCFELLRIPGFSVLTRPLEELAGFAALPTAAAQECRWLHDLVGRLITLEVQNCQRLVAEQFAGALAGTTRLVSSLTGARQQGAAPTSR
jgi:hypothetical protein